MPELPEVQTIISDLNKVLPGLTIRDFWCDSPKMIKFPKNLDEFRKNLVGKKILEARRRGKNILIDLSDGFIFLLHQKMTGHLLYGRYRIKSQISNFKSQNSHLKADLPQAENFKSQNRDFKLKNNNLKSAGWEAIEAGPLRDDPYNQHIHFVLVLSNGTNLALSDVRKFAKIILGKREEIENLPEIKSLGLEPLQKNFTFQKFQEIIFKKSGRIKTVLMDQKNIAGIGNIYADEILWEADVHPSRVVKLLSKEELKKIYNAILKVLKIAVKARGDSMSDYRRPSGKKGNYQNMQNAYKQTGKPCKKNDGGVIKRIKIGQRSTHFCFIHQK